VTNAQNDRADAEVDDLGEPGGPVVVPLASGRVRHLVWAWLGLGIGGLFVWMLGPVGQVIGAGALVLGVLAARAFGRTLLHQPGAIELGTDTLVLPDAPCTPGVTRLALSDVHHAYLLRRSAPFLSSAPVLVVETKVGAFSYPRDWFDTDADQRRLAAHINRRVGLP
jgi:hypothetical protein